MSLVDDIRAAAAQSVSAEGIAEERARRSRPETKLSYRARNSAKAKNARLLGKLRTDVGPDDLAFKGTSTAKILLNVEGIKAAMDQVGRLPEPGESWHFIMSGNYHGFDVIPAIYELATGTTPVTRLIIATLGFSRKNNLHLCKMIDDGMIVGEGVFIICSQFFAKTDPKVYNMSKEDIEARGGTIRARRNHAKIIAMELGENSMVIEGSANLRSCVNYEQITIFNSRELFDFHQKWLAAI